MNFSEQEQSSHTFVDENFKSNEINSSYNEFSDNSSEMVSSDEQLASLEFSNQSSESHKNTARKKRLKTNTLRKYLSCVVAGFTMGAIAVAPVVVNVLVNQPGVSMVAEITSETTSYNSYECFINVEKSDDSIIGATITSGNGERQTTDVQKQNETYRLYFDDLTPETEYDLSVVDNEGSEHFVDKFKTDALITLEEPNNNRRKLNLHKDFPSDAECVFYLLSADGRNFSSNITTNYQDKEYSQYIQLDGLYADTYTIQLELYPQRINDTPGIDTENNDFVREIIVYEKQIEFSGLQKIHYQAEFINDATTTANLTQIYITYLSGDFGSYSVNLVRLVHKISGQDYIFDFSFDENNDIIMNLSNSVEPGEYDISIYGWFEANDYSLDNEIWKGTVSVLDTSNM